MRTSSASVTIEVYNLPPTIGGLEDIHFASGGEVREVPLGNVITDPDDVPGLLDVSAGCDMGGIANVSVVRQGNGTCMLVVTAGKPASEAVTATIWVEVTDGDGGTGGRSSGEFPHHEAKRPSRRNAPMAVATS